MSDQSTSTDLGVRVTSLETAVAALAQQFSSFQSIAYASQDDLKNHTEPLADALATLQQEVAALPAVQANALAGDDAKRNTWVDNVLHKFFSGEEPALPSPDATT